MLGLTRKVGEEVVIEIPPHEKTVRVTVGLAMAAGGKAKIGFDAPTSVGIARREMLDEAGKMPSVATRGMAPV